MSNQKQEYINQQIMQRGRPLITDFISMEDLHQYLLSLPPATWDVPPYQYHYKTSPSGYAGCPMKEEGPSGTAFYMVRGTAYHEYYGPKIAEAMGLEPNDYMVEPMFAIPIDCELCGKKHVGDGGCMENQFPFGGSLDFPVFGYDWLIDFKFSKKKPSEMKEAYKDQLVAYSLMGTEGYMRLPNPNPNEKYPKSAWAWEKSQFNVKYISILHIHPDTLMPTEVIMDLLPYEEAKAIALEHHQAKEHGKAVFRKNPYCKNCNHWNKPWLRLQNVGRGKYEYEIDSETQQPIIMRPCCEGIPTNEPLLEAPVVEEKRETVSQLKDTPKILTVKELPKIKTSKRNVRCAECDTLTKKYYRIKNEETGKNENKCVDCFNKMEIVPEDDEMVHAEADEFPELTEALDEVVKTTQKEADTLKRDEEEVRLTLMQAELATEKEIMTAGGQPEDDLLPLPDNPTYNLWRSKHLKNKPLNDFLESNLICPLCMKTINGRKCVATLKDANPVDCADFIWHDCDIVQNIHVHEQADFQKPNEGLKKPEEPQKKRQKDTEAKAKEIALKGKLFGVKKTPTNYHLICKKCGKAFKSTIKESRFCDECKGTKKLKMVKKSTGETVKTTVKPTITKEKPAYLMDRFGPLDHTKPFYTNMAPRDRMRTEYVNGIIQMYNKIHVCKTCREYTHIHEQTNLCWFCAHPKEKRQSMNIMCHDCGLEFTSVNGSAFCDECLRKTSPIKGEVVKKQLDPALVKIGYEVRSWAPDGSIASMWTKNQKREYEAKINSRK